MRIFQRMGAVLTASIVLFCLTTAANGLGISSLATTDDGGTIYFVAPFGFKGTAVSGMTKVWVRHIAGMRVYAEQFPNAYPLLTTFSNVWVSGDGQTVAYGGAYTLSQGCNPPWRFMCVPTYTSYNQVLVQRPGDSQPMLLDGPARFSANGRYALVPGPALVDLVSNSLTTVPVASLGYMWAGGVGSDGTVMFYDSLNFYLWGPNHPMQTIAAASNFAVMDDAVTTIIFGSGKALYHCDIASGNIRLFANGSNPTISRDGRWVALVSPADEGSQAWAVASDGSQFIPLTKDSAGATLAVVSGDGRSVIVVTGGNAIVKFDLPTAHAVTMVPATPDPDYFSLNPSVHVAGSLGRIRVPGLVAQTMTAKPPLPREMAGYSVWIDSEAAPILSISPSEVVYQNPWERISSTTRGPIRLVSQDAVLEAAPGALQWGDFAPVFLTSPCTSGMATLCVVAMHADSSPVTLQNPAAGGERITLSMSGLGAVSPPLVSGEAGPANPPAVVRRGLSCSMFDSNSLMRVELPVVSAVFTPGEVGTYQVTVRLPQQIPTDQGLLSCGSADLTNPVAGGWVPLAPKN